MFLAPYVEREKLVGDSTENWRFHLAFMMSFALTRNRQPTVKALAETDPHTLEDVAIEELYDALASCYGTSMKRGKRNGIDRLARSADFTQRVRQATYDVLRL